MNTINTTSYKGVADKHCRGIDGLKNIGASLNPRPTKGEKRKDGMMAQRGKSNWKVKLNLAFAQVIPLDRGDGTVDTKENV